jgi:hypothetical protein
MSAATPLLDDVLESYVLGAGEAGLLERYVAAYPQFAVELVDLAHAIERPVADDAGPLSLQERPSVDRALAAVNAAWPAAAAGEQDLFAGLVPAAYGQLARALGVPLQVIAAVRNRRAIPDTIPRGFLRRMAEALSGTLEDLMFSIDTQRLATSNYKAVDHVVAQGPVPFEQILIEARVPEDRRREILAERD